MVATKGPQGPVNLPLERSAGELAKPFARTAASTPTIKESPDSSPEWTFYYLNLLWMLAYDPDLSESEPEEFETLATTILAFVPDDLKDDLTQRIDALRQFSIDLKMDPPSTKGPNPLISQPPAQLIEHFTSGLNIPMVTKAKFDPKLNKAIEEAKAMPTDKILPADGRQWTLSEKVFYTMQVAHKYNLDATKLVAQIRQESGFRTDVGSTAGALGIAQFIRPTGEKYGLKWPEDFRDPRKALDAMAHHMRDLANQFGSQDVALAAYNGGPGAVLSAKKALGTSSITVDQLMGYWQEQRSTRGIGKFSDWRNQTYDYVARISGWNGPDSTAAAGTSLLASAKPGLSGTFDTAHIGAGSQPKPLTLPVTDTSVKPTVQPS